MPTMQATMTPRERLFAFLDGQPTDRTPMWMLFPYHTTSYYVDVRTNPAYVPVFKATKDRAIMLNRRNPKAPIFTSNVEIKYEDIKQDGTSINRTTWRHGDNVLTSEWRRKGSSVTRKHMLECEADLEILATFPIETDPARLHAELDKALPQYLAEREEFPEQYGSMMLDLGEPIGFVYHNANLEEYAIWSMTHNDVVIAILDKLMQRWRAIYQWALNKKLAEVYFLVGSELASPPMVSRDTFQQWVVPYAKQIIDMIHDADCRAIQHYHGQIKMVLPDFLTMGADAIHTIEEPPVGDCTLDEAFDIVGDRAGLIGCIQYDNFRSDTPEQMAEAVRRQLKQTEGKRFMLSPSAGPFDKNPPQRVIENYLAFIEAGWNG